MRSVRIIIGLAIASCAFGVAALPALATPPEFESTGGAVKGKAEGEQHFSLGAFEITCQKAKITGDTNQPLNSQTLFLSVSYRDCGTAAKLKGKETDISLKTKFLTPFNIEYNANGLVQKFGSESTELEGSGTMTVSGGAIEVKVAPIKCVLEIEAQSNPFKPGKHKTEFESAEFGEETVEIGKHEYKELLVTNLWKGIHYEYGSGQCEEFPKAEEELKNGKYEGEFLVGIHKGNLNFVS